MQCPLEFGGPGIHNLELVGYALHTRRVWAQKTDPLQPWARLSVVSTAECSSSLYCGIECIVGNGEQIRFWANRWLQGKTMAEVAPNLHKKTSRTVVKNRTVAQALHNRAWMGDIKGALTVQVLVEYLHTHTHPTRTRTHTHTVRPCSGTGKL